MVLIPAGEAEVRVRVNPNLKPGTVCVFRMNGVRTGMHTTEHPPSPASRAGTDLPTTVQAVARAVSYVIDYRILPGSFTNPVVSVGV